ncbi:universal stress protein [Tsukamurella sp. 8F]|uniref:universal stress protein n=1 Tax=unclassified Tsukamurella TaxID=2633480 RepID=UPI0023B96990|nr:MULTISPECIES: universal stress protein [unclassified Tsukamurella]MDF0530865.1 universal stress protein [Tsukamurella sp. 8J]MDF0588190.1 universal stress protein [Tsukamurella sp. 8F]
MSILVGYKGGAPGADALLLGARLAAAAALPLHVMAVAVRPRNLVPGRASDAFGDYTRRMFSGVEDEVRTTLDGFGAPGLDVRFAHRISRSTGLALVDGVAEVDASAVVMASAPGREGRITVGPVANRLIHSSTVPVAIAPLGWSAVAAAAPDAPTALVAAFDGSTENEHVLGETLTFGERLGAPVRVATFGVRGATMYPPEGGVGAEDEILAEWSDQAQRAIDSLRAPGGMLAGVTNEIVTGDDWDTALSALDWRPGDLLCVGTTPHGGLARVFMGTRGTRILTHSPVPVVALPA